VPFVLQSGFVKQVDLTYSEIAYFHSRVIVQHVLAFISQISLSKPVPKDIKMILDEFWTTPFNDQSQRLTLVR